MTSRSPQSLLQLNGTGGFVREKLWLPTDDDFVDVEVGSKDDSSILPHHGGNIGWFAR